MGAALPCEDGLGRMLYEYLGVTERFEVCSVCLSL